MEKQLTHSLHEHVAHVRPKMTFLIPLVALWLFCWIACWLGRRYYHYWRVRWLVFVWRLRVRLFGPPPGWQWGDLDDEDQSWGPDLPGN